MNFLDLLREKYFKPMDVPWIVVQKQPFQFTAWLLVVPGVGFAGFWLPLVLLWARGEAIVPQCAKLLSEGTIASACAAILAEGLLAALTAEKSGTNAPALGLRGIAGGMATLLIILLIGTMVSESANIDGTHLGIGVHLLLAFFLFQQLLIYIAFDIRTGKRLLDRLPEKVVKTVLAEWEPIQYDLYSQYRNDMRAVVMKDGMPAEDHAEGILKRLMRLVQIASNPRLVDQSYVREPGKFPVLLDLVHRIRDRGQKCIVWSSFIRHLD